MPNELFETLTDPARSRRGASQPHSETMVPRELLFGNTLTELKLARNVSFWNEQPDICPRSPRSSNPPPPSQGHKNDIHEDGIERLRIASRPTPPYVVGERQLRQGEAIAETIKANKTSLPQPERQPAPRSRLKLC